MDVKHVLLSTSIVAAVLMLLSCAQGHDVGPIQINEDLALREIDEGVFFVTHSFPWVGNSLLVRITSSDFVLVDTPWENSGTRALVEWLEATYGTVNLSVITTHFHWDNLGGNEYLLDHNIPVYGSDLTAALVNERGAELTERTLGDLDRPASRRYYEAYKATALKPPDNIFKAEEGLLLDVGNERIELFYPGAGHTKDNIVVYFPSRQLLFGGCLVKALENSLGRNSDGDLAAWPSSLQELLKRFPDAETVVPGHGQYGDMQLVTHTIELLKQQ